MDWLQIIQDFCHSSSALALGVFSVVGELVDGNHEMRRLLGIEEGNPAPSAYFLNPSFADLVALAPQEGPVFQGQMTFGHQHEAGVSLAGRVFRREHQLLVLCEYDPRDLLHATSVIAAMNREINNLQRTVLKEKFHLEGAVTELRQRDRLLAETQRLAHVGSWTYTPTGQTLTWSEETFRIFGLAPERGEPSFAELRSFVHPNDWDRFQAATLGAVQEGRGYELELRIHRPDRSPRHLIVKCQPQAPVGGRHSLSGSIQDITEHKQDEETLRQLNATLEERVTDRTAVAEQRAVQLQSMALQLTQAEHHERRRIAQVLHDYLQQLLVAARLRTESLRRRAAEETWAKSLEQIEELLQQCIAESRSLTVQLSPPILYEAGLTAAIQWLARQMQQLHGLAVTVEAVERAEPADECTRLLLFQTVRELLFNVVKHARVDRAHIAITTVADQQLQIEVSDGGTGFNHSQAEAQERSGGFGLFSARERLELIGGWLKIDTTPGRGTRMVIVAPLCPVRSANTRPASAADS